MADETQILKNRFKELHNRALNRGTYFYSDFLNMHEQTLLFEEVKFGYTLCGGYDGAERKIACFGDENDFGYPSAPPIDIILIEPLSAKFSDDLTHRDFLGSLMGLGIKRETLGDIITDGNKAYLFCLEQISEFIIDNLTSVRRTSVCCSRCDELPAGAMPKPTEKVITVSSFRLDGAVASVYGLSRSKSSALIDGSKVFVDGKLCENTSYNIKIGETVSVRGFGRFRYAEILGTTKKNKTRIQCETY